MIDFLALNVLKSWTDANIDRTIWAHEAIFCSPRTALLLRAAYCNPRPWWFRIVKQSYSKRDIRGLMLVALDGGEVKQQSINNDKASD